MWKGVDSVTFEPAWQAILLDGLPHDEAEPAVEAILERFAELPSWPQLPRRSPLENMYALYAEGFPGLREDAGVSFVEHGAILERELGELHLAYLDNDVEYGRISASHAMGLDALLRRLAGSKPKAIKGEITGPVSWSLTMLDEQRRPILYDRVLEGATAQHLRLKAAWQERVLRRVAGETIIILNEPYMASFGSSFVPFSRERAISLFSEVLAGIQGIGGVHCCGATDWSVILDTSARLISWDAYDYMASLLAYAEPLATFVERGGILCWGMVPAGMPARWESPESLADRIEQGLDALAAAGIDRERAVGQSMVSPSCGLGGLDIELAELILNLTRDLARTMQQRYPPQSQTEQDERSADDPSATALEGDVV